MALALVGSLRGFALGELFIVEFVGEQVLCVEALEFPQTPGNLLRGELGLRGPRSDHRMGPGRAVSRDGTIGYIGRHSGRRTGGGYAFGRCLVVWVKNQRPQ